MGILGGIGVAGWAALAGTAVSGVTAIQASNERNAQANDEAAYLKDAAQQQATQIMRARRKQAASARVAIAGSGTALDQFSEINTNDIERLGASDEQLTLLTGERRANAVTSSNAADASAARLNAIGSFVQNGYGSGWKGGRG